MIPIESDTLNIMIRAAARAGHSLVHDFAQAESLLVSLKNPRDFVTAADRRAEEIVYDELTKARPNYGFLGEEVGWHPGTDEAHRWIVDPLDGTTNFLHQITHFAVAISLEQNGVPVAAVVYNPVHDEMFIAERGKGAFVNDKRIFVNKRTLLAEAIVACGLPHRGRGDLGLARREIAAVQEHFAGLRRFGSAALDLAWIAAGRFDAYWQRNLSPWDLSAGILLVSEAGGIVTDLTGNQDTILKRGEIVAGNEVMHRELLKLLEEASQSRCSE